MRAQTARNARAAALLAAAALAGAACGDKPKTAAPAPAAAATGPMTYGKPAAKPQVVAIADLLAHPEAYDGKVVRVEGTITDVAAKGASWIKVAAASGGDTVLVKFDDPGTYVPKSATGSRVVADGTAHAEKLDLERSRAHLARKAKDAGKEFDPATVKAPIVIAKIDGVGAVVSK